MEILENRLAPANFGTVQGILFIDANNNGILNAGDGRIHGIAVTLTGTTDNGPIAPTTNTMVVATAVTDARGNFKFTNVPEGNYKLQTATVKGVTNGQAQTFTAVTITSAGSANQVVKHNFRYRSGLTTPNIGLGQFLTSTSPSNFPYGTPGSGTSVADHKPVVAVKIPDVTLTNDTARVFNLAGTFADADYANSQVTFHITKGSGVAGTPGTQSTVKMTLFDAQARQTVANFYNYVTNNDYDNSVFHRLAKVASGGLGVLQGGSLKLANAAGTNLDLIPVGQTINNEFLAKNSNKAGTIAMAQSGGNANSATNQFFFNTVNNTAGSGNLDAQRFTVFGKVADNASLLALNALAQSTTKDLDTGKGAGDFATTHPTTTVKEFPLTGYNGNVDTFAGDAIVENYITITDISIDKRDEFLTYSIVTPPDAAVATATITNGFLSIKRVATGTTTLVVKATDRFGASVNTTIKVTTSGNVAPVASDGTATTNQNTAVTGTLTATDADVGDTRTFSIVQPPPKGSVTITNTSTGAYNFNPGTAFKNVAQGETEPVTFTFKAIDSHGASSATKTITVTVTGLNDAPVATDIELAGTPISMIDGMLSATDPDAGATLTYSIEVLPPLGTFTLTNALTGAFTFDPGDDFDFLGSGESTPVTITYKATDEHGLASIVKSVHIVVTG